MDADYVREACDKLNIKYKNILVFPYNRFIHSLNPHINKVWLVEIDYHCLKVSNKDDLQVRLEDIRRNQLIKTLSGIEDGS